MCARLSAQRRKYDAVFDTCEAPPQKKGTSEENEKKRKNKITREQAISWRTYHAENELDRLDGLVNDDLREVVLLVVAPVVAALAEALLVVLDERLVVVPVRALALLAVFDGQRLAKEEYGDGRENNFNGIIGSF